MYGIFGSALDIHRYYGDTKTHPELRASGYGPVQVSPEAYETEEMGNGAVILKQTEQGITYKLRNGTDLIEATVLWEAASIQNRLAVDGVFAPLTAEELALLGDYISRTHHLVPDSSQIDDDLVRTPFLGTRTELQRHIDVWRNPELSSTALYQQAMPDARASLFTAVGINPLARGDEMFELNGMEDVSPAREAARLGYARQCKSITFAYTSENELCGLAVYWREDLNQWIISHSANCNAEPALRRDALIFSGVNPEGRNPEHVEPVQGLAALERLRREIRAPLARLFLDAILDAEGQVVPEAIEQWRRMQVLPKSGTPDWHNAQAQNFDGFVDGIQALTGGLVAGGSASSSSGSASSQTSLDMSQSALLCRAGMQRLNLSGRFAELGEDNHPSWAWLLHTPRFEALLREMFDKIQDVGRRNAIVQVLADPEGPGSEILLALHAVGTEPQTIMELLPFFQDGTTPNVCEERRQVLMFLAQTQCRIEGAYLQAPVFAMLYRLLPTLQDITASPQGASWLRENIGSILAYVVSDEKAQALAPLLQALSPGDTQDEAAARTAIDMGVRIYRAIRAVEAGGAVVSSHGGQAVGVALTWLDSQQTGRLRLELERTIVEGTPSAGMAHIPQETLNLLLRFPQMTSTQFRTLCLCPELSQVLLRVTERMDVTARGGFFYGLFRIPATRLADAGRLLDEASRVVEDRCNAIRTRLQGLVNEGVHEAADKLAGFDANVGGYKAQMYFAIAMRLVTTAGQEQANRIFSGRMLTAERQFDTVLEADRHPWLRKALNAITWAVSVIISCTVPFGLVGVAVMHTKQYMRTGDLGFFARAESSRLLHEADREVESLLSDAPTAPAA